MTTLPDYYDMLARHDWTYMMSDDPTVYRSGSSAAASLQHIAKESPRHMSLYNDFHLHVWGHGSKPERPDA